MDYLNKWKIIDILGEGGQGKVFRVRRLQDEQKIQSDFIKALRELTKETYYQEEQNDEHYEKLRQCLLDIVRMESPSEHFALKVLHKPSEARDADLARERIGREIKAMSEKFHPNLIKVIDVDPESIWYVSQFYAHGTLDDKKEMFKGNVYEALKAIRPLVEAVATLHEKGYVHRDIKPQNVFLNSNNELILGDFGLVYFVDDQHTRISNKYENVGSRDWMPPWAMGIRIEDVKPTFDVFSLGKLLWSMVSGKPILRLWYFDKNSFNVEKLFPESRNMRLANQLFAECIVEDERSCLQDASELLQHIDKTLASIELGADVIDLKVEKTCRVCGIGKYQLLVNNNLQETHNFGFRPAEDRKMKIFECSNCGNVQLFSYVNRPPDAWRK